MTTEHEAVLAAIEKIRFTEADLEPLRLELNEALGWPAPPEPGERCRVCNRRRNKKRTENEPPSVRRVVFTLPADRAESVDEGLDALQEIVGADPSSYPKGHLLEALVVLGAQHREDLTSYFNGS